MNSISSIDLFNALKDKVGEQEAKMLTEYVDCRIADAFDKGKENLSTKEDIARVEIKIAESKADLLKWMIVLFAPFYIGMIAFLVKQFL